MHLSSILLLVSSLIPFHHFDFIYLSPCSLILSSTKPRFLLEQNFELLISDTEFWYFRMSFRLFHKSPKSQVTSAILHLFYPSFHFLNIFMITVWTLFLLISISESSYICCWFMCTQSLSHVQLFVTPGGSCPWGFFQARILEHVAISSSRGSSQHRDWTHISCIDRQVVYHWMTWEAWYLFLLILAIRSTHMLMIRDLCSA